MFHVAMLIRVVEIVFLIHLRGVGVRLRVDGDAVVQVVHVNAIQLHGKAGKY